MSLNRIIMASVATHGVFERFAKLSAKDKKKVIKKVKDKVKSKGKKDDKPAKGKKDDKKKPAKGKVPPQFLKKDDKKDEKEEDPKEEKAEKPAKGKVPPQFLKNKDEAPKEDGMADEAESDGLEGIVDGLAKEIEVIKGDGKVEMSEVMGLIENLMGMVDTLVNAKPAKKKKASERDIADRVVLSMVVKKGMTNEKNDNWESSDVENAIRDHLSGNARKTKERNMYNGMKRQFEGLSQREFSKIWKELIDEKYLIPVDGGSYVWEM